MSNPTSKRKRSSSATISAAKSPVKSLPVTGKSPSNRLFADEDEIDLLKSHLRATKSELCPPPSTSALVGGKFTEGQIIDKIRRLRKKYHKLAKSKSRIKTPHDRKIYELGRQIWGKKSKESPPSDGDANGTEEEGDCSEDVSLGEFPVLMTELSRTLPENAMYRAHLERLGKEKLRNLTEKWMVLRMEQAELLAKKANLFHEQTKLELESFFVFF